jgi:hypothetical protein
MADKKDLTEVRVLRAFDDHQPNHVISLGGDELKARLDAGDVDDNAAAVAYAKANEPQPAAAEPAKA